MKDNKLEYFSFTVPANSFERFGVSGDYVRILSTDPAGAELLLETFVQGKEGSRIPLATGRDADLGEFTEFRLTNKTGSDIEVEMIAGFGLYRSQELAGSVSIKGVVQSSTEFVDYDNENCFIGGAMNVSSNGDECFAVLANPTASGVDLIVERIEYGGDGGQSLIVSEMSLSSFESVTGYDIDAQYGVMAGEYSKKGATAPRSEALMIANQADSPGGPSTVLAKMAGANVGSVVLDFGETPYIVKPGQLLYSKICDVSSAGGTWLNAQWREVDA